MLPGLQLPSNTAGTLAPWYWHQYCKLWSLGIVIGIGIGTGIGIGIANLAIMHWYC